MKRLRQRGVALLAVSVLLAVVGALAYLMTRQGAMAAHAVDAQYDTQAARYLAEAGLNVAKWRAWQLGCGRRDTLVKPSRIDANGTYSAFIDRGDKTLDIDALGATDAGGARVALSRKNVVAHERDARDVFIPASLGQDSFISAAAPQAPQHDRRYLELTQNVSSALLQFELPADMFKALIVKAELTLILSQSNAVLPGQEVSAHRLTRKWDAAGATWLSARATTPWSNAGADFVAANVAATTIGGNGAYSWDLMALVDGWANNAYQNYGVLLRADGPLQQAQFNGLQSAYGKPSLRVTYYRAC